MTGHIVGLDPMTGNIVVLRRGQDGKAVRQVDVITPAEARELHRRIRVALDVHDGRPLHHGDRGMTPLIEPEPEPEQTAFDLDALTEGNTTA